MFAQQQALLYPASSIDYIGSNDMKPAIFLDRDGVIIENRAEYVRNWSDVKFLPDALDAISKIDKNNFRLVIVTNQSAVGRGIISLAAANRINDRLLQQIRRAGGDVDGVYMCPHQPADNCSCRKPLPGLLLRASKDLDIDLPSSFMVGDASTDILAGHNAGVRTSVLVETGRGKDQKKLLDQMQFTEYLLFSSLPDALSKLNLLFI